jgi:O-antigen/teichoic acid export membrane protein
MIAFVRTETDSGDDSDAEASGKTTIEPQPATFLLRALRKAGVDGAVEFAVLAKVWQLLTGPLTQLILVVSFTKATQDYYYAFSGMLGMQVFVELGLHVVLISVSSHEWSRLSLQDGRIVGDAAARSRLISLGRMMLRWYGIAALVFVGTISMAGLLFFGEIAVVAPGQSPQRENVAWLTPWIALVIVNGLQLPLLPLTAILEGCNQLLVINRVRFWQAVAGTVTMWLALTSGLGLWSLVASAAIRLAGELYLVAVRYRPFFTAFRSPPEQDQINWKHEILPLQWRIAVQGILLWVANSMPLLLIFKKWPEGAAAQLGMTWAILTALQGASLAWIETRRPAFGALIAERKFRELDQLFFRTMRQSMLVMTAAVICFSLTVWWMGTRSEWLFERLAGRMLPVGPTAMFSMAMVLLQFALCTNLYVRAHKRDPFLLASIVSSLTVAALQIWLGTQYGSSGVAAGYLLAIACVQVPLWTMIWVQTRKEWHTPEPVDA